MKDIVYVRNKEVTVLEEAKCSESKHQGRHQCHLRPLRPAHLINNKPVQISDESRAEHQEGINRLTKEIKHQTRKQQYCIF